MNYNFGGNAMSFKNKDAVAGLEMSENGQAYIACHIELDKALEYLEDHPDMTVVASGGQGENEPTSEAQGMADYLADHGFARENIILETQSHNTNQNLRFSAQCLAEAGVDLRDGVIIVSNGFHLTRARMLAHRIGFEDVSVLAAPSSHTPTRLKMYVREPLALVKSFVFDLSLIHI